MTGPKATQCTADAEDNIRNWGPFRCNANDTLVAVNHTHPTEVGQPVYGCRDVITQGGDTLRFERWPGDTTNGGFPAPLKEDEWGNGGGSPGDWDDLQGMIDGYVINAIGEVWMLRKEVSTDPVNRLNNLTYYVYYRHSVCDW